MTDVNTCSCFHCQEQRQQYQRVKDMILWEGIKCCKCDKQASHEFILDEDKQILEYTCLLHSTDFDPQLETYVSVVKRYEALMWLVYPYNIRVYSVEDQERIIENDINLRRHVKKVKELEMQRRLKLIKK